MSPIKKILSFVKQNLKNHKKKYIALSLLIVLGYYIKKKMTSQKLIQILIKVVSILQYIPLPEAPKYREINQYQTSKPFNFQMLKTLMSTQPIAAKIQDKNTKPEQKQELWKQMMRNVFIGYSFTVSFFDLTQIFNMIKCKYVNDFRYFGMERQFLNYILGLNSYFSNNLSNLFTYLKIHQQMRIDSYDPNNKYSPTDIYKLLEELSLNILSNTEDISEEVVIVKNKKLLDEDVSRLFYTDLEKQEPKPRGRFVRAVSWIWDTLRGIQIQDYSYDPSKCRFSTIKHLFRMGLFQVNDLRELFKNHDKATQLFDLVNQQLFDILKSLNFHMLWQASVIYNTRKFINRLDIYLKRKQSKNLLLGNYLSIISKICIEEFANPESIEINNKFLDKSLKQALKLKSQQNPSEAKIKQTNILLEELVELSRLQIAKKELILKFFHERGDVDIDITEGKGGDNSQEQMKEFLNRMSQMGGGEENEQLQIQSQ